MKIRLLPALLLFMTASAHARPPDSGLLVGQPFPVLTLPSAADGRPVSVAEYRGRKLLLQVFASW